MVTARAKKPKAEKKPAQLPLVAPEAKSQKTPPSKAPSPLPVLQGVPRRTIFVDVENASNETDLGRVLEGLQIDRAKQPTELVAVGNWRAVGQRLARHLAGLGAQLVHSAPAGGVRDWSDLWIAVAAGMRLGRAAPGDKLEIVSDDRAFDAVGDLAANLGVTFTRVSTRAKGQLTTAETRAQQTGRVKRQRKPAAQEAAAKPAPASVAPKHAGPLPATEEQILAMIARLSREQPGRWINLDVLENALKAEGFSRPPRSPRLVTRLRHIAGVEVRPDGAVRQLAS